VTDRIAVNLPTMVGDKPLVGQSMNDLTTVAQEFLTECREDYVGLWTLVKRIRGAGAADDSNILKTTLDLVLPLLSEGAIIAGQFARDSEVRPTPVGSYKFHQWKMPTREVIAKIGAEWRELGHDPNIGEIVWFTSVPVEK
jgi:hypothetical protein